MIPIAVSGRKRRLACSAGITPRHSGALKTNSPLIRLRSPQMLVKAIYVTGVTRVLFEMEIDEKGGLVADG